jgi:5-methylcytosine-specific restriction protein A
MSEFKKITELLSLFSNNHKEDIKEPFHHTENAKVLTKELPQLISSSLALGDKFKVKGSVGNGNWSEIPWLAILDKEVTETTTEGYYIALLFSKDLDSVFLVLSMGYVQFEKEYGIKDARIQSSILSERYAAMLNSQGTFLKGLIDLGAQNNLGKGYENGTILSKEYKIETIDSNEFKNDLVSILDIYQELKTIVGDSILNLQVDISEINESVKEFKKEVAKKSFGKNTQDSIQELIEMANSAPVETRSVLKTEILRNRKFSNFAKERVGYICEICGKLPFRQKNDRPYAEADHIDPISNKKIGSDSPDNLRCLCAQCHAVITYGSEEEINKLFL